METSYLLGNPGIALSFRSGLLSKVVSALIEHLFNRIVKQAYTIRQASVLLEVQKKAFFSL